MADRLEELVFTDDSKEMIDIINVLLIGWILLGLIVYIVGNIIANQLHKHKKGEKAKETPEPKENATEVSSAKPPLPSDSLVNHKTTVLKEEPKSTIEQIEKTSIAFPSAVGSDPDAVRWTNDLLEWIQLPSSTPHLVQAWIRCLNEKMEKKDVKEGIKVNFEELQMESRPVLTDIKASIESEEKVIITSHVTAEQLSFVISADKELEKIPYNVKVKDLLGKLKIDAMVEELSFLIQFIEYPSFKINVLPQDKDISVDKIQNKELFLEALKETIATTVVDVNFSDDSNFPQFQKTKPGIDLNKITNIQTTGKLILKSIKASNLGGSKGCIEPYCVIEIDDPGQKFETIGIKNTNSPIWDQQFTFNLNNISSEVLFETYDKGKQKDNFLGLGIVSLEELSKNHSKRHIIPLQSRPLEKDEVTGALTIEFSFMDVEGHSISGVNLGKIVETNSRVTPGGTVITTTTIKRTVDGKETIEESLADAALRELESRGKSGMPASKSTLIIHSVAREAIRPTVKVKLDKNGRWHEVSQHDSPGGQSGDSTPSSPPSKQEGSSTLASTSSSASERDDVHRSRPKEKRSLMGTLRRRLSLRKTRSKSMEQKADKDEARHPSSRSVSADRSRSMPGSRETSSLRSSGNNYLHVPGGSRTENDSTRSSISEASGISSSSTRTYLSDKSTLVIEANENGVIKRYLIPSSLANRSKWRKKGIKLHVYNDHVFVAKHFSGVITCQVCNRHLSRRPGKQGYECRDCNIQCHKPCHVKVEGFCPNSTVNTMEVEYVQDTSKSKQS